MTNFKAVFTLQAAYKTISFDISAPSEQAVTKFFIDFLSVFPGVINIENATITSMTRNSEDIKNNLHSFVGNFPQIPELKGIEAFINRLPDGETFFVIPSVSLSQSDSITINNYLHSLRDGEPDLIDYLILYRTMYGIKGKGGEKEFKGKNFEFFKNENLELHYSSEKIEEY